MQNNGINDVRREYMPDSTVVFNKDKQVLKAFAFAENVHHNQKRKDGSAYITHPFEVALILMQNHGDSDLVCAGFLHDVIEDTDITEEELKEAFPEGVTSLVIRDSEDKNKSWEERKSATVEAIKHADRRLKMLMCADKLANLRSIDLTADTGADPWAMFSKGKEKQKWLYGSILDAIKEIEELDMYREYRHLFNKLFN